MISKYVATQHSSTVVWIQTLKTNNKDGEKETEKLALCSGPRRHVVLFVSEPMFEKKLERRGLIFYQVKSIIRISITNIDRTVLWALEQNPSKCWTIWIWHSAVAKISEGKWLLKCLAMSRKYFNCNSEELEIRGVTTWLEFWLASFL